MQIRADEAAVGTIDNAYPRLALDTFNPFLAQYAEFVKLGFRTAPVNHRAPELEYHPDLQEGLDGSHDRQVEGDHDKEDHPAEHCPKLPLPHPPPVPHTRSCIQPADLSRQHGVTNHAHRLWQTGESPGHSAPCSKQS